VIESQLNTGAVNGLTIAAMVVLALLVLGLATVAHRLWRVLRGAEELEAGGSLGRQLFGRYKSDS
jgi:hypothetical protein